MIEIPVKLFTNWILCVRVRFFQGNWLRDGAWSGDAKPRHRILTIKGLEDESSHHGHSSDTSFVAFSGIPLLVSCGIIVTPSNKRPGNVQIPRPWQICHGPCVWERCPSWSNARKWYQGCVTPGVSNQSQSPWIQIWTRPHINDVQVYLWRR